MPPFEIDQMITSWFNQFAHIFPKFDHLVYMIAENNLLKGGVIICLFYGIWWDGPKSKLQSNRKTLITTLLAAFAAEIVTIILSLTLPYRARPFTGLDVPFSKPYEVGAWWSKSISSFPSDHATLFTVLGLGIFICNKRIGSFAIAYILLFIFLPRLYLGFHYLSDLLAGITIGSIFFLSALKSMQFQQCSKAILEISEKKPAIFYPLLFLISYQLVDLFIETREIIGFFRHP